MAVLSKAMAVLSRPASHKDFKLAKLTFRRGGPHGQPGVGFRVFTFTGIGSTAAG